MVQFSQSFKAFLLNSDSRLGNFIYKMRYHYHSWHGSANRALTTEHVNYLTLRSNGMISFLPAGKEHMTNEDGTWMREGRQEGKPSKVIRKILSPTALKLFTDKDFESFCMQYKASCDAEKMTFEIRSDIAEVYCMQREDGEASLNGSCMNGDRRYIEFYEQIPDVKIIAMLNNQGHLAGRALLWRVSDELKVMDRVYVAKDHYYELFIDYAKDNGFMYKKHYKTYDYKDRFIHNGEESSRIFRFQCPNDWDYYPYIDTFAFGDDGFLTNEDGYQYTYNDTGGTRSGDEDMVWDALNHEDIPESEARYIDRGRYRDEFINLEASVRINGEYWWSEDEEIVWISGHGYMEKGNGCVYADDVEEWMHEQDVVYSEHDQLYYSYANCVYTHNGDYILSDDSVEINGLIYHKNEEDAQRSTEDSEC